jgi:hypothetical protein
MIFDDLGTLVIVETIDTDAVGGTVAATGVCAFEILAVSQGNAGATFGVLDTLSRNVAATGESLLAARGTVSQQAETLETALRGQEGPLEWPLLTRAADGKTAVETLLQARSEHGAPVEWSGAVLVVQDGFAILEGLITARGDTAAGAGYLVRRMTHSSLFDAWLESVMDGTGNQVELNALALRERLCPIEWMGNAGSVDTTDMRLWLEWVEELPSPISVDKLLRSPGRVRVLGPSGRVRLLKGD